MMPTIALWVNQQDGGALTQELVVKFHGRPSIASMGESTGWVCRDVGSGSHLMRATLWQVLNVSNVHTHCATATGCSVGVEVCGQTTVAAADKGT